MILLSNTLAQTIPVGGSITFDRVILQTGCGESHRHGTSSVRMRHNGVYEVHFAGNIASATAGTPVQLSIELSGEILLETTMIATASTANAFNNVATATLVKNQCGDYDRVSVKNTGTEPVTVGANTSFFVKRLG